MLRGRQTGLQLKCTIAVVATMLATGFCHAAPAIAESPALTVTVADQTDCKGNTVEFEAQITGAVGTVSYQWQRKRPWDPYFIDIDSLGTFETLVVHNIGVGDEAPDGTKYRIKVTDDTGTYTSDPATLHVNRITGIAPVGKANYTLCKGASVSWTVMTAGTVPVSYQWIKHLEPGIWEDIPGATGTTYSIIHADSASAGEYKIRVVFPTVNGETCIETSTIQRNVYMNLVDPGVIAGNETVTTAWIPAPVISILDAAAPAGSVVNYGWEKSEDGGATWVSIPAANGAGLIFTEPLAVSTLYRRTAFSTLNGVTCSSVPSGIVTKTVVPPATINPVVATIDCCIGQPVSLTYSVGGAGEGAVISSGTLPDGITATWNNKARTFTIAGIPSQVGIYDFTVTTTGLPPLAVATGEIAVSGPTGPNTLGWIRDLVSCGFLVNGSSITCYDAETGTDHSAAYEWERREAGHPEWSPAGVSSEDLFLPGSVPGGLSFRRRAVCDGCPSEWVILASADTGLPLLNTSAIHHR